jgi:hypothetical protein
MSRNSSNDLEPVMNHYTVPKARHVPHANFIPQPSRVTNKSEKSNDKHDVNNEIEKAKKFIDYNKDDP